MRKIILLLPLMLAACGEPSAEERAASDAEDVAEVRALQTPPPEMLAPEVIGYPDIEEHQLYGAGCSFVPEGGGLGAIAIAMADEGYMKQDGEILRFAADKGSEELPYLARREYDGSAHSFTIQLARGGGERTGMESSGYEGRLTVRDSKGRVVYESPGYAQCGA